MSVLEPRVTSNAPLRFSIFSKPSYFCWWNCVSADKAQSALSAETKFHIQKCNTCRYKRIYREAKYQNFLLYNGTVLSKVVFTAVYILILEYIHVTCYYGFSTAVHVQQCSTKFSIVLARPRGRQLQSSNRMNHPWNHRGIGLAAARSVATGGRAPGVGRSEAAAARFMKMSRHPNSRLRICDGAKVVLKAFVFD